MTARTWAVWAIVAMVAWTAPDAHAMKRGSAGAPSGLIPPGARAVSITAEDPPASTFTTIDLFALRPGGPWPLETVTSTGQVTALRAWLDDLPASSGSAPACPRGFTQPSYQLRFLGGGDSMLATATENGCGLIGVTAPGRDPSELAEPLSPAATATTPLQPVALANLLWAQHALPVCTAAQLAPRATFAITEAPQTETHSSLGFANRSRRACALSGTPSVALYGTHGRPLPTHATDGPGPAAVVTIVPHAQEYFAVSWPTTATSCSGPAVGAVRARLPGVAVPLTFPVHTPGNFTVYTPCHGDVRVTAIAEPGA